MQVHIFTLLWAAYMSTSSIVVASPRGFLACRELCQPTPSSQQRENVSVTAVGGLTSRLRVVLSYLAAARTEKRRLVVHWVPDSHCPAFFAELFVPFATDLDIVDTPMGDSSNVTDHTHPDFRTRSLGGPWRKSFSPPPPPDLGPMALALLRPLPHLLADATRLRQTLGRDFAAVHIRRTDMNVDYSRDVEFAQWAQLPQSQGGGAGRRLFVAADTLRSVLTVRSALPQGSVVAQGRFNSPTDRAGISPTAAGSLNISAAALYPKASAGPHRLTSVAAAVVDIWVASYASAFRGTPGSSFSGLIEALRRARTRLPDCDVSACVWC
jgi:hypothetical protein